MPRGASCFARLFVNDPIAALVADAEVRLYDRLFSVENPGTTEGKSFLEELNPESLVRLAAKVQPWLATTPAG